MNAKSHFILMVLIFLFLTSCNRPINTKTKTSEQSSLPTLKVQPINPKMRVRFVVMADSRGNDHGINKKIIVNIMKQIKKITPQPQFIIMPGDLVNTPENFDNVKNEFKYFKKTITNFYPIETFYPGIGNHEVSNGVDGEKAFKGVFKEFKANFLQGYNKTVYYFDKGDSRFFMLNSDHNGTFNIIDNSQLAWLKENLDPNFSNTFYFFHEPAFPTGEDVNFSLDAIPYQRDKLWKIIDNSIKPMVFCGHEHFYTRRHVNPDFNETVNGKKFEFEHEIYQVTTGTFGAPLHTKFLSKLHVDVPPIAQYHFTVVDVNGKDVKVEAINMNGKVIDSFEQNK